MNDADSKRAEQDLRARAADAFRLDRPKEARPSKFDRFDVSAEQSKDIDESKDKLEESVKSRFR